MILIDSHCHLNYPEFSSDMQGCLERAEAAGVTLMQTICTKMSEFDTVHQIALTHPPIYCSVGVIRMNQAKKRW